MIKYQLICDEEHEFEGWFGDSAAFEEQRRSGLLICPVCGCDAVRRALMAPNLASPKTRKSLPEPTQTTDTPPPAAAAPPPEAARRMQALVTGIRALRTRIKDECRDVGSDFAEEARKIHYGKVEPEGIYGHATAEEREALDEEGIDVLDMPWLPKDN